MPGRTALAIRAGTRMEQGSVRPSVWLAAAASPRFFSPGFIVKPGSKSPLTTLVL